MILDHYEEFIKEILNKLSGLQVDVTELDMDHLGYQASSDEDYDRLRPEFLKIGKFICEKLVGNRRVGVYKLTPPLEYKQYRNRAIELIAPTKGQICQSALDHVEFVINESFTDFMAKYPNLPWDTSAISQPEFPMIKLRLSPTIQVKFHYTPVLEIVS